MKLITRLKGKALRWSLPLPFSCRHVEYSTISSLDDDSGRSNERLLDISLEAIAQARSVDLSWISKRMATPPYYPEVWPGEHYKLLAGLVATLKPKRVVEVGTFRGLSALAIQGSLPPGGEIITVDIVPWNEIKDTAFRPCDFEGTQLRQVLGDLSQDDFFQSFAETLKGCGLLFIDGPKNIIFEEALLRQLASIRLPAGALVLFDDTRQWNMQRIWRQIARPKVDLTSFGHSGLIDWNG